VIKRPTKGVFKGYIVFFGLEKSVMMAGALSGLMIFTFLYDTSPFSQVPPRSLARSLGEKQSFWARKT